MGRQVGKVGILPPGPWPGPGTQDGSVQSLRMLLCPSSRSLATPASVFWAAGPALIGKPSHLSHALAAHLAVPSQEL